MTWPAVVTCLDVAIASGYALAGLFRPAVILPAQAGPNAASAIFAQYAAARTLPLAVMVFAAAARGQIRTLAVLGLLAGATQALDGVVGLAQHDPGKTIGPFVVAALQLAAVFSIARRLREPNGLP